MEKKLKEKLEKNILWVLLTINHFSKHNGAGLSEIAKADKRKVNLNIVKISKILTHLKNKKLVDSKIEGLQEIYIINSKGKKVLNKNLRQLKSSEFMDFLSLAPDEIIFRYRIYHIERFIFYGVFGWLLFQLSLFLIRTNHIYSALVVFLIDMLFIGLGIGFLSNILTVVLYEFTKNLDNWLKKWPKLTFKISWEKFRKISIAIFLILLSGSLILINLLFRNKYPEAWEIFLWGQSILIVLSLIIFCIKKLKNSKNEK
ncbi:MAG: hypothetical protein ABIH37_01660 [archaeon]